MSEIVNLRRARKQRARTEAEASANRAKHGRTKAERELSRAEAESAAKKLDDHKREHDG